MPDDDFTNQVALITGGGRGLGQAFAEALAKAEATVAIVARSERQLRNVALAADVTDRQAIDQVVAEVERLLGRIGLLVNNAGVFRALGPIAEIDPNEWWRVVEINLRGAYLCAGAILPGVLARARGRIINVVSAAGLQALPTTSAYCVSKAALIRLSESLALETGAQGVCVFAMHPGTIRTPLDDYVLESDEVRQRAPFVHQWFQQLYRDGRDTPIERAVELLLFLASGKADALSGRYVDVDDDLDALLQQAAVIARDDLYTLRLRTS